MFLLGKALFCQIVFTGHLASEVLNGNEALWVENTLLSPILEKILILNLLKCLRLYYK